MLIGPLDLQGDAKSVVPRRAILNFVGGTVTDVPQAYFDTDLGIWVARTDIVMTAPGGAVGSLQVHVLDGMSARFGGSTKLNTVDGTAAGDLVHTGKPIHKEDWAEFRDGSGTSLARSQWKQTPTTNATLTAIATVDVTAATYGDCFISVHAETSYAYTSSGTKGGIFSKKATFQRSSGTLARVAIADLTPAGLGVGPAPGGFDIAASGNDAIVVNGTGIAATNITWVTSLHIQLVKP